jgi:hypothetical protein
VSFAALRRFGPYFVEPVICGLSGPDNTPFIAAMDLIGAPLLAKDSVVAGTCSEALYGMTESLWKPDLVRPASMLLCDRTCDPSTPASAV